MISVGSVPSIEFVQYDKLLDDITKLANEMKQVKVTEENINEYKKLLARARKEFTSIDNERKNVKKQIMKPYDELDAKIKHLRGILKEGEDALDVQIKAYRDAQRASKWDYILVTFERFREGYEAPTWLSFDMFKTMYPNLANASSTQSKINDALTSFFEQFDNDYKQLKQWYPVRNQRTSILAVYANNGLNLMDAVQQYEKVRAEGMRLQELEVEKKVQITVDGKREATQTEYVMVKIAKEDLSNLDVDYELV